VIRSSVIHGKAEGQVEVAVIERAIPSHAELAAAHQLVHRVGIKRFPEKLHVTLSLIFPDQVCLKSSQGHIGDREKVGKYDFEPLAQLAAVILFKDRLGGRKKRSSGIVHKREGQLRV
jgi:hypothetical protein